MFFFATEKFAYQIFSMVYVHKIFVKIKKLEDCVFINWQTNQLIVF